MDSHVELRVVHRLLESLALHSPRAISPKRFLNVLGMEIPWQQSVVDSLIEFSNYEYVRNRGIYSHRWAGMPWGFGVFWTCSLCFLTV